MKDDAENPIPFGLIEADLRMAKYAIISVEELGSKKGKHLRGQAGYHLQQAAEKMIKRQIYASGVEIDNAKIYKHSLEALISYAESIGIMINIPEWIDQKKSLITSWEAEGRYYPHFVARIDTLKRCYSELETWFEELKK